MQSGRTSLLETGIQVALLAEQHCSHGKNPLAEVTAARAVAAKAALAP